MLGDVEVVDERRAHHGGGDDARRGHVGEGEREAPLVAAAVGADGQRAERSEVDGCERLRDERRDERGRRAV